MRGNDERSGALFSYVDLEARVPQAHPLRTIRAMVNEVLAALSGEFAKRYAPVGRPSIPPERLLRALLLQAFYSIRSERQLVERIEFDLLFRWFVGLGIDDPVWDATSFTQNRERLLEGEIAAKFLAAVLAHAKVARLLSSEHFSVDGTLIEAWASVKSFQPKDGSGTPPQPGRNGARDFHGEARTNATHASTTDPDAQLFRKGAGKEAKLCFMGHALMENRNGLVVGAVATRASGHAERLAALHLVEPHAERPQSVTLGADKKPMTPPTSSWRAARSASPRTWRRTPPAGVRRSMGAPPAIPVTPSAKASASASRKPSAGPRRSPASASFIIAACPRSLGSSPSPWPPTTSFACPSPSPRPPEDTATQPHATRPPTLRPGRFDATPARRHASRRLRGTNRSSAAC